MTNRSQGPSIPSVYRRKHREGYIVSTQLTPLGETRETGLKRSRTPGPALNQDHPRSSRVPHPQAPIFHLLTSTEQTPFHQKPPKILVHCSPTVRCDSNTKALPNQTIHQESPGLRLAASYLPDSPKQWVMWRELEFFEGQSTLVRTHSRA